MRRISSLIKLFLYLFNQASCHKTLKHNNSTKNPFTHHTLNELNSSNEYLTNFMTTFSEKYFFPTIIYALLLSFSINFNIITKIVALFIEYTVFSSTRYHSDKYNWNRNSTEMYTSIPCHANISNTYFYTFNENVRGQLLFDNLNRKLIHKLVPTLFIRYK